MAEQDGDKTEAPTARKREEARKQGKFARSQDLVASALLLTAIIMLGWTGQRLVVSMKLLMERLLGATFLHEADPVRSLEMFLTPALMVLLAIAPLAIAMVVVAVLVNVLQVGLHADLSRLKPKLSALNPVNGLSKLFKGGRGPVQLLFNILKMTLVASVAYSAIHGRIGEIVGVSRQSHLQITMLAAVFVYEITFRIAIVLLVLAILDFAWQKFRHERDLRMTKQEVKDEMKRMEGDPKIKQRRRQIQFQKAMQRIQKDVPRADVVVTNPTHYAVALQYDSDAMHAPRVLAKGADFLALKIRQIASENGIPIVERPPLARALYKDCQVGQEIPESFYSTVAEILAYVYELSGKMKRPQAVT